MEKVQGRKKIPGALLTHAEKVGWIKRTDTVFIGTAMRGRGGIGRRLVREALSEMVFISTTSAQASARIRAGPIALSL